MFGGQVTHTIGPDSPLYSLSPRELLAARLEFIFSVEAVVEPSGNTTQVGGKQQIQVLVLSSLSPAVSRL